MIMTRLGSSVLLAGLLVSVPAFGALTVPGSCSLATLQGAFGTLEEGTVVGQLPGLPAPPWPAANVAIVNYDGAGNFSGSNTASFNGVAVTGTFTGTYTVNSDCTYSDQFTASPLGVTFHHAGVIRGGPLFRRVSYIYTDASIVASGTLKKTPPGGCSQATVNGAYVTAAHGLFTVQTPGLPPPPYPFDFTALFTADGAGNLSGDFTLNYDGFVFSTDPFNSTYAANADCTYSDIATNLFGAFHETGIITGTGVFQEIRLIDTDAGYVEVETFSKQ
jgi:hypothetical protein